MAVGAATGESRQPCGVPVLVVRGIDRLVPSLTCCFLLVTKFVIHSQIGWGTCNCSSLLWKWLGWFFWRWRSQVEPWRRCWVCPGAQEPLGWGYQHHPLNGWLCRWAVEDPEGDKWWVLGITEWVFKSTHQGMLFCITFIPLSSCSVCGHFSFCGYMHTVKRFLILFGSVKSLSWRMFLKAADIDPQWGVREGHGTPTERFQIFYVTCSF